MADATLSPAEVVRGGRCIGCGSCAAQAPAAVARVSLDRLGHCKPAGDAPWLQAPSARLAATCPFSPQAADETVLAQELFPQAPQADPQVGRFAAAWVGHVAEGDFRTQGSSGGMVSWVAAELLRTGRVDAVVHVGAAADPAAEGGFFGYRISRTDAELRGRARSRYHPVEMSQVLREVLAVPGRYAFVGVPCFVKAVQLLRRQDAVLRERIVATLGLFCGHMKSAHMTASFARQMGVRTADVAAVDYRVKLPGRPANWYRSRLQLRDGTVREQDWFQLAEGDWGSGFFQNPACNFCDDVVAETADIAFGDAWVEPYASDPGGTNVVVVRSPMLAALVQDAVADGRLALTPVDAAFVVQTQAAGFRQRREGLAYRLSWLPPAARPRKRVAAGAQGLSLRRRLVYRMRALITACSTRLYVAVPLRLYLACSRAMLAVYQALAWSRGRLGEWFDRWLPG